MVVLETDTHYRHHLREEWDATWGMVERPRLAALCVCAGWRLRAARERRRDTALLGRDWRHSLASVCRSSARAAPQTTGADGPPDALMPTWRQDRISFPDLVAPLVAGTALSVAKLLAAWDGLTTETQILALRRLGSTPRDLILKALEHPNVYVRHLAAAGWR